MNNKTKIICGAVVVALCGGVFFFNKNRATNQVTQEEMALSRTFTLVKGDLESTVDVSGVIVSAEETEVTTDINAKVVKLNVKEGDKVKKGDVICVLDSSEIDRQIKELQENKGGGSGPSKSVVTKAKNALKKAEELEQKTKARFEKRYNATSDYRDTSIEKKYAQLQNNLDDAHKMLISADAQIVDKQATVEKAQTEYDQAGVKVNLEQKIENVSNKTSALLEIQEELDKAKEERLKAELEYTLNPTEENAKKLEEAKEEVEEVEKEEKEVQKALTNAQNLLKEAQALLSDKQEALSQAQKELAQAESTAEYKEAKKAYENADRALKEYEDSIYSQYQADREAVNSAIESRLSAQEALESLYSGGGSFSNQKEIEKLQEQKEACTLKAESSGEITSLKVKLGSISNGSIALIQSTEHLIFQVSIPEESINKVKKGLLVTVTATSIEEAVTGKLTQISSTTGISNNADYGMSTSDGNGYKAQITLDKPGGLHIGSKASGSIVLSSKKNIFVVPIEAVGNDEGLSYIRVAQPDGSYKKIAVEIGESNEMMMEISGKDLEEGMEVLSDAYYEDLIAEAKMSSQEGY
ncbi:MAG: biotin/lipoyl-binding protein [Bacillota bacterium]|nr:biotin/lipoyl-binding protein [Bacillota bacterium]